MRKKKRILLLIILSFSLIWFSCIEVTFKIKENGSGYCRMILIGQSDSFLAQMVVINWRNQAEKIDDFKNVKPMLIKRIQGVRDGKFYAGWIFKFSDISQFSDKEDRYWLKQIDPEKIQLGINLMGNKQAVDIPTKFIIEMPGKIISANAGDYHANKLEWYFSSNSQEKLRVIALGKLGKRENEKKIEQPTTIISIYPEGASKRTRFRYSMMSIPVFMIGQNIIFDASANRFFKDNHTLKWDFGDGGEVRGKIVDHTYLREGTYTGKLTIENKVGYKHSIGFCVDILGSINKNMPALENEINRFTGQAESYLSRDIRKGGEKAILAAMGFRRYLGQNEVNTINDLIFSIAAVPIRQKSIKDIRDYKGIVKEENNEILKKIIKIMRKIFLNQRLQFSSVKITGKITNDRLKNLYAEMMGEALREFSYPEAMAKINNSINDKICEIEELKEIAKVCMKNFGPDTIKMYINDLKGRNLANSFMNMLYFLGTHWVDSALSIKNIDFNSKTLRWGKKIYFGSECCLELYFGNTIGVIENLRKFYEHLNEESMDALFWLFSQALVSQAGLYSDRNENFDKNIVEAIARNTEQGLNNIIVGRKPNIVRGKIVKIDGTNNSLKIGIRNDNAIQKNDYKIIMVYSENFTSYELLPGIGRHYKLDKVGYLPISGGWIEIGPKDVLQISEKFPQDAEYITLYLLGKNGNSVYGLDIKRTVRDHIWYNRRY